jgi:hypothetical protein
VGGGFEFGLGRQRYIRVLVSGERAWRWRAPHQRFMCQSHSHSR